MKRLFPAVIATIVLSTACLCAEDVKALYDKECAKCHGPDGAGKTKMGEKLAVKDYTSAKVQAEMKDADMAKAIKEGMKDSTGKSKMKAYDTLSEADIKGLVAYIRKMKK
jgi:mono/diheme cytochrome c family protein